MRRPGKRDGRAFLLAVAFAAMGATSGAGAEEELTLGGHVQQSASLETPLSGEVSFEGGAATTLALVLDSRYDAASLRASLHFSASYRTETSESWTFLLALDDLALRWDIGSFAFEAGKTYANWGVGKAFSPADFFVEFDYASGSPARRSSFLGKATWFPGSTARVDLVVDPCSALGSSLAVRAYATAFDSLAFSVAAGFRDTPDSSSLTLLGALEAIFDLSFISPYLEAAVAAPMDNPAVSDFRFLGGAMARAGDLTLLGEYLFSPVAPARHSVFAQASLPVDEWIALSAPLLYYPESGALSTGISLTVNGLAGLDLGVTASAFRAASPSWSGKLALSALWAF